VPPIVFLSYSHKDEVWKDRILTHLAALQRNGQLQAWNDREIRAGQEWLPEIERAMEEARVAVLLVSPHFLASGFIQNQEVPRFLERRAEDGVHVFPVIVKDCLWEEEIRISRLQARPQDGKPLAKFRPADRDTELKKIAQEILRLLREESAPAPPPPPIQPAASPLRALHQLPPPPTDFTGREADLAELRTAVQSGGVTISGVRGMGGIGKTALALKLAQELTPDYPDAQIHLDLQGVSDDPVPPAQAMAHVIRAFHPDAKLPESEADLGGLYRSALYGKRALLLMDNAAGREQVKPLVPPAGCLLLVTSRFLFHLPGLHAKDLDEMRHEDACELLLRITPRIGKEADRIAKICAGLPFALHQAAGTLSERPDISPTRYADRLTEESERLGLVEATLALSYDLLPEELACRWRVLALFPTSFDALAAAAVWAVKQDEAEIALGELVRRSLVDGEDGRYRLHDLARVFAGSLTNEEERSMAERLHAVHYRDILAQADDLYREGGPSLLVGLRLVDREWPNIQAAQAWAAARMKEDREAAELVASYSRIGAHSLSLRLRSRERIGWLKTALEAAQLLKDRYKEGYAMGNLGIAYADLGETRRAIEFYEQRLSIAREIGDRHGEANATGNLGNAYADLGETRRAIEFHEQNLAIAREIGDRRGEGNATGSLGLAYAALGETRRAIEFHEQYLAITREIGDRRGEGIACWNLGLALEQLGELERAAELMQIWVDYEREIGHPDAEKDAAYVTALRNRIASAPD
jgi:tetratricopeptide (TPR) repeat protein